VPGLILLTRYLRPHFGRKAGFCAKCGYDLRGSPGLRPRCPECGTEVIAECRVPSAE
jgi:predicted Zn-ribbon and HTH transcriptional regulator